MKVLDKAKNEFNNIEYFTFEVTNKDISKVTKRAISNYTFNL